MSGAPMYAGVNCQSVADNELISLLVNHPDALVQELLARLARANDTIYDLGGRAPGKTQGTLHG